MFAFFLVRRYFVLVLPHDTMSLFVGFLCVWLCVCVWLWLCIFNFCLCVLFFKAVQWNKISPDELYWKRLCMLVMMMMEENKKNHLDQFGLVLLAAAVSTAAAPQFSIENAISFQKIVSIFQRLCFFRSHGCTNSRRIFF